MKTLDYIRKRVIAWTQDKSDLEGYTEAINHSIDIVTESIGFTQLLDHKDIKPDANGCFLIPARCQNIFDILPKEDSPLPSFRFVGTQHAEANPRYGGYRYRTIGSNDEILGDLIGTIPAQGNVFTKTGASIDPITAEMVGEEFQIRSTSEKHEVVSVDESAQTLVFKPNWYGVATSDTQAIVRPLGMAKIQVYSTSGQVYTGDITVSFFRKHPFLYGAYDRLMIPAGELVALETVRFFLRVHKYDVDAERLESEWQKATNHANAMQPTQTELSSRNTTIFSPRGRGRMRSRIR